MTRDYYAEARDIAQSLDNGGLSEDARGLRDAIAAGATGTEILMALRWHLQRIANATLSLDFATREKIRDLTEAISSALGG